MLDRVIDAESQWHRISYRVPIKLERIAAVYGYTVLNASNAVANQKRNLLWVGGRAGPSALGGRDGPAEPCIGLGPLSVPIA